MKKLYLVFGFVVIGLFINAQPVWQDTIEVSEDLAATLMFKSNIQTPIFGNNPMVKVGENVSYKNYDVFVQNNVMVTSAKRKNTPFTTLTLILANGKVFKGYIKYNQYAKKNYYDYTQMQSRQKQKETIKERVNENIYLQTNHIDNEKDLGKSTIQTKQVEKKQSVFKYDAEGNPIYSDEQKMVRRKLELILQEDIMYKTIGLIVGTVEFQVTNIRNDNKYSYFKIRVDNNSSTVFDIAGLMLRYVEKEGFFKNKEKNKTRIFPTDIKFPDGQKVKGFSYNEIVFAIEQFGTDKGFLIINVNEKTGDRNINIEVPIEKVNAAPQFGY